MKKVMLLWVSGTFFLASGAGLAGGSVTGKVSFGGKAAKPMPLKMTPDCKAENKGAKVFKDDVVVNANGTLANVFVYVKEGAKGTGTPPTQPVVFDQRRCMYSPHIFGIQVNQTLKILNSDPLMHNVHFMAKKNKEENNGMLKGQTLEKKFTKVETPINVKCDVHGWMNARAFVLDHPYFGVTDTNGAFTISGVPAGQYTLEAWHEKLKTQTLKVTVTDGGTATADFSFGSTPNS